MDKEDAQLIAATLSGETAAFGQLVQKYQDRLYAALLRWLRSAEDAHDIAQDSFVQAFLKLDTFQGKASFYTWLYRIAFNLAVSGMRKRRPTISLDQMRETRGSEPMDDSLNPTANLIRLERATLLHNTLDTLSEEYRQVLVLREMEGFTYEEISHILALPLGTIRSRLFRARLQLKEKLPPTLQPPAKPPNVKSPP